MRPSPSLLFQANALAKSLFKLSERVLLVGVSVAAAFNIGVLR